MIYPNNRLIVNGIDITEKFGIILLDGYTLGPPVPKTYVVDIPGGNGKLDLTEVLLGDTAYDNRTQTFPVVVLDPNDVETIKTRLSNFLHGKSFDYQMTMDPDYTYTGRFSIESYSHTTYSNFVEVDFSIKIDAKPFKMARTKVFKVDGVGGVNAYFESGRQRVRPIIQTNGFTKVIFDNKEYVLGKGTWTLNDVTFINGTNKIYFNTFDIKNLLWSDLKTNGITWGSFRTKPLYQWYKSNGDGTMVNDTWNTLVNTKWSDLAEKTWGSLMYKAEVTKNVEPIYIEYEWGDL